MDTTEVDSGEPTGDGELLAWDGLVEMVVLDGASGNVGAGRP